MPISYKIIFPPVLNELKQIRIKRENITFMIVMGSHQDNSKEKIKTIFREDLFLNYKFINHNSDDQDLKYLGRLKSGVEL